MYEIFPFEVSVLSVTDSEDTGLDISCSFSSKNSLEFLGYLVWFGILKTPAETNYKDWLQFCI